MQTQINQKLRDYIAENFLYARPGFVLKDQDSLLGNGIVDSMGVMEMMAFLESEFGVVVKDEDVTEEHLGSIAALERYVLAKQSALPVAS